MAIKSHITVTLTGFNSREEAEQFIKWYEGQGEQDIPIWLECRKSEGKINIDSMNVDLEKTYPLTWKDDNINMVLSPQ